MKIVRVLVQASKPVAIIKVKTSSKLNSVEMSKKKKIQEVARREV